ncbi:hypothetical protein NP233_g7048 [Leucocoprinus birnbaumii]|uniref:Uncharacterized protein n=1 Tax=Leucocoprinus birnbaumii TaxID=56174 RepID=A0AAD5VT82_9AGAR|nr:hypothetical protein NP233_g7048 [Leucocoprinus birnbaumii]
MPNTTSSSDPSAPSSPSVSMHGVNFNFVSGVQNNYNVNGVATQGEVDPKAQSFFTRNLSHKSAPAGFNEPPSSPQPQVYHQSSTPYMQMATTEHGRFDPPGSSNSSRTYAKGCQLYSWDFVTNPYLQPSGLMHPPEPHPQSSQEHLYPEPLITHNEGSQISPSPQSLSSRNYSQTSGRQTAQGTTAPPKTLQTSSIHEVMQQLMPPPHPQLGANAFPVHSQSKQGFSGC